MDQNKANGRFIFMRFCSDFTGKSVQHDHYFTQDFHLNVGVTKTCC